MDTMTDTEIDQAMTTLEGWERDGDAITKTYRFDSFPAAIAFIQRLAPVAQDANHHPELTNVYDRVEVRLTTHDAGGVTGKDLELARALDTVA